jgi:hypothetical protein
LSLSYKLNIYYTDHENKPNTIANIVPGVGNCLFLFARGWGNLYFGNKKYANSRGSPGGMVTGRTESYIRPNKKKYLVSVTLSQIFRSERALFLNFYSFFNFLIVFLGGMGAVFPPYR